MAIQAGQQPTNLEEQRLSRGTCKPQGEGSEPCLIMAKEAFLCFSTIQSKVVFSAFLLFVQVGVITIYRRNPFESSGRHQPVVTQNKCTTATNVMLVKSRNWIMEEFQSTSKKQNWGNNSIVSSR